MSSTANTFVLPDTVGDTVPDGNAGPTERAPSNPADGALAPGDRAGPYVIESVLASGGFGVVYRGVSPSGEGVAVKVLKAEVASHEQNVARFEREVDAVARIDHRGVVRVKGRGRLDDGRPYFAMELLRGRDLAAHIADRGALPWAEALSVLEPVCEALAAAHERHIIHRDIKASNVFLSEEPGRRVVLLDFGVAKIVDESAPALTRSRQLVGTPTCMAPEQLAGGAVDPRTDVYALGVLAFHMLTGSPPFAGQSPVMIQHLHRYARRPRVSALVEVPAVVDQAIVSAMAVEPSARPAGARALLAALERGEDPAARPSATERRRAVAVRIDVTPSAGRAPASEIFDELERVTTDVERRLVAAGFQPAFTSSRTLVFARPVESGRGDAIAEAEKLASSCCGRARAPVAVTATVRAGEATFRGERVVGGPLLELTRDRAAPPPA